MNDSATPSGLVAYPVPRNLDDPKFRWIFDYWRERFRGDALPARSDVDPVDFPGLLGRINLIDVVQEPPRTRFRYRLWGSIVTELMGKDCTGQFLDEIDILDQSEIGRVFRQAVETRQPHFWQRPVPDGNQRYRSYRRLLLPLAEDGERVDMFLSILVGDRIA